MIKTLLDAVANWPVIVQGALGSALFWIALEGVTLAAKAIGRAMGAYGQAFQTETRLREYIWRKFSSRSGLVNYTQGFFLTFDHVFRYLLYGLIFTCIALILAGASTLTYGICLTAALYFFVRGLIWLTPNKDWHSKTTLDHWNKSQS